ncbi:MAG TPA: HYR domain-containing protein [Blastocatellia bacterium]|nr:HYR domain-containing protein [Blastocatellia bacterium]
MNRTLSPSPSEFKRRASRLAQGNKDRNRISATFRLFSGKRPVGSFIALCGSIIGTGAIVVMSLTHGTAAATCISLTTNGTAYTQDFNTLASTGTSSALPSGWALSEAGSALNTTYTAGTGSSTTGDTYSFGATGNTERAFGGLQSGSLIPTIGACFTNDTGGTLFSLAIAYTGEQWRLGATGRVDRIDFQYSLNATSLADGTWIDVNALDFTAPVTAGTVGALNGNAAANRTAISSTIGGLSIPSGATFFIRWTDLNASGSDDGLAVDDFSLTPNPPPSLSINDVVVLEGDSGTTTTATFTVSLSSPALAGGVTFDIATQNDTATTADNDYVARTLSAQSIAAGNQTYTFDVTINGDATDEPNETFFVNVTNVIGAVSGDTQGVGTISNDDFASTPIHTIQGNGNTSPFAGSTVTTLGVVTAVKSNGFFIQAKDAQADGDPNTSEGIFVFTSSTPPAAAAPGNYVVVMGLVQEFIPSSDPNSPSTTELAGSPTVSLLSTGNPLPAATTITAAATLVNDLNNLEKYEGMRAHVDSLTVIAPTQGSISEANATSTSNGVFYGVITGVSRPFREPGVQVPDPLPPGSPCCVPRFDGNPERLRVDSDGLTGTAALEVTTGAVVTNITGPLDYAFRTYTILPDPGTPPSVSGNISAVAVPVPTTNEFTIASFNTERFFDTVDDPSTDDVVLTTTAFNNRLKKASLAIRNVMRTPDIIGVEEMENLATLQALADKVNADAVAASQPNPLYQPYLVEGNDIGGIDVGFLVKSARVSVIDVTQFGKDTTYINPNNGQPELLNDRPPLVLRATIQPASGPVYPITVIVNHLRSLSGVDDPADGNRVRTKRRAQAEYLANLIQARQAGDPTEHIVSLGDYNAFEFNDGYVDSIGTIRGAPTPANQVVLASADLVNPDLTDLITSSAADQKYSFSFDGNAQALDHELITANLMTRFAHLNFARNDADFPESFRTDANRPERISDHDMPVAYFTFPIACSLSCPANITRSNDSGQCGAVVSYSPITTGDCNTINCVPASGSLFPLGTTTVTCSESAGGAAPPKLKAPFAAPCSFTVTITDTQPPTIMCPANVTKPTDPNKCTAMVTYSAPAVIDNCPANSAPGMKVIQPDTPLVPVCNPASGSIFPKGTTTVLCTVLDAHSNQASCRFNVTVNDTQPPVFTNCRPNVYTSVGAACPFRTSAPVSYTYPTATENCAGGLAVTCNPPTGSTFPVGTTAVNCTATDGAGNVATCSFQLNVFSLCMIDETNPGNVVFINALTGDYRYCCNGVVVASGRGVLNSSACVVSIDHQKGDRRVFIQADTVSSNGAGSGAAFINIFGVSSCQISDRSLTNNTCTCN